MTDRDRTVEELLESMSLERLREIKAVIQAHIRDRESSRMGCEGKAAYDTQLEAMEHVVKTLRHGKEKKVGNHVLRPYRCKVCGKWHMGHTTSTARRISKSRRRR